MSEKNFASKDEIKQARQADIAQYLMSKGVQLKKSGRFRYKSVEHDSLVFTGNAYYWNSLGEHGNALDFVTKHMNMEIPAAVKELIPFSKTAIKAVEQEFKINNIDLNPNIQRAIAYLTKSRSIDNDIIQGLLIKNKLIFQSKKEGNIVFPIKNEKGDIVGAELNGTLSDRRFKGIAANSAYGYGFNIRTSEIKDLENYIFFESTIDMLSYINIQYNNENLKEFKNTLFVSMGGLKINIVKHMLDAFKGLKEPNVFLCVDNINIDKAAKNFSVIVCDELKDIKVSSMICSGYPKESNKFPVAPISDKDWNEQLSDMKKESIKKKLDNVRQMQNETSIREEKRENNRISCR